MKTNNSFEQFLFLIWNNYTGTRGLMKFESQIEAFKEQTEDANKFSLWSCIFDPYYLSKYYNFKKAKRETISSFFRFSKILWNTYKLSQKQEVPIGFYDEKRKEYFEAFEEMESFAKLLILSEIFDLCVYKSPNGFHRHKCDDCGHVWEHSNSCSSKIKPHECPKCGQIEDMHYEGPEPPTK